MEENCIFCKIIKGEIPSKKVYENEDVLVFENINPVAEVHLLICPKKHVESFLDIEKDFNLSPIITATQKIIKEKNIQNGYKLVINGGKYQTIPHLHLHLLAGSLEEGDNVINKT